MAAREPAPEPGRAALALDLMEEFRFLADRLALTLINREQIGAKDFVEREGGAVLLEGDARNFGSNRHDLANRGAISGPEVIDRVDRFTGKHAFCCAHVCSCDIGDVNVIANAGAIERWVVVAIDGGGAPFAEGTKNQREQVVWAGVAHRGVAATDNVEVAKRGVNETGGFGLISDSLHPLFECLFIKEIIVLKRGEVLIEFENERASSGNVIADDVCVRHLGEMLNDGSQGVTVSHDNYTLAIENHRADLIIPVR
jgi:hypothetical protein